MKPLMRLLFLLTILLTLSLFGLLFSIFQPTPLVSRVADLTMDRMEDGKRTLDANDPRRLRAGEVSQVSLTQEDLDLAVNYLANQYARGSASLALQLGRNSVRGKSHRKPKFSQKNPEFSRRLGGGIRLHTFYRWPAGIHA